MNRRHVIFVAVLTMTGALVGLAPSAGATTSRFVNNGVACDDSTVDSTTTPYCTIQAAVDDSGDTDTVFVAAGTYTSGLSHVVLLDNLDVTITGAGQGVTIISGSDARRVLLVINSSNSVVSNLTVSDGNASSDSGGAISVGGASTLQLTDVTVAESFAAFDGGGIFGQAGSSLSLLRVSIVDNDADNGAGIYLNTGALATITDSSFRLNTAGVDGGAVFAEGSNTIDVSGSYFTLNSATTGSGGAIFDDSETGVVITNSTFYDNDAASQGGAMYSAAGLFNVTVSGNSADTGGGIADNGFEPYLNNSIVYGNTATVSGTSDCNGTFVSGGYNVIGDPGTCPMSGDTGTNLLGANPLLSAPTDNGGPTQTMEIAPQSPARDAGDPAAPGSGGDACPDVDQRAEDRNDTRCDIGAYEVGPQVLRYAGNNRYATAAAVSAAEYPVSAQHVFIATGFNFPDALAGAVPAGIFESPLLLVDSGVPSATSTELTNLEPFLITILGGTGVVSDTTETALEPYALDVERVFSSNRYLTAVAISQATFSADGSADVVYVATGLGFADALAAAPAAAFLNGPVLLVDGISVNQAVADEIVRLTPNRIIVVGGTAVVSDAVLTALDTLQGSDTVVRISGSNRYATAVAISQDAFPDGSSWVYVATGLNFPDALAGAAAAGSRGAPVLLVPGTSIPTVVSDEITRLEARTVVILGGTAVVSSGVEDDLKTLIGAS